MVVSCLHAIGAALVVPTQEQADYWDIQIMQVSKLEALSRLPAMWLSCCCVGKVLEKVTKIRTPQSVQISPSLEHAASRGAKVQSRCALSGSAHCTVSLQRQMLVSRWFTKLWRMAVTTEWWTFQLCNRQHNSPLKGECWDAHLLYARILEVHLCGCSCGLSWLHHASLHLYVTARPATEAPVTHCPTTHVPQPLLHLVHLLRASLALHGW